MKLKFLWIILAAVLVLSIAGGYLFAKKDEIFKKTKNTAVNIESPLPLPEEEEVIEEEVPAPVETKTEEKEEKKEEPKKEAPAPQPAKEPEPEVKDAPISYSEPFQWGVTMRPNGYANYTASNWQDQINKAKELGTGWARVKWDYNAVDRNTAVIDALRSNGIGVVLVVEHNPALGTGQMYQDGLNDGRTIGAKLKGKVKYYQLANEGGAQAIKSGTLEGIRTSDYDDGEYNRVRDYIKGLSEGLSAVDSSAYRIVTISWLHTGFLDRLKSDNVNYDMIGIDWYSWMGSFSTKKISDTTTLYSKLKSFGKPLTFMEVNILPKAEDGNSKRKTVVDEEYQTNFITALANWSWNNRNYIKGYFVLELVDNINVSGEYVDYYGLVKADRNSSGVGVIGAARQAFGAYRDLISGK